MNPIAQLYSPIQHVTLWLGAYAHGLVSYDEMADAVGSFATRHQLAGDTDLHLAGLAKLFRQLVAARGDSRAPAFELVLCGPGDPAPYGAQRIAGSLLTQVGAGIIVHDVEPLTVHVAVPEIFAMTGDDDTIPTGATVEEAIEDDDLLPLAEVDNPPTNRDGVWMFPTLWQWHVATGEKTASPPMMIGPGDADRLLVDATEKAAALIQTLGDERGTRTVQRTVDPRLTVGRLSDYFDLPGVPGCTPVRSQRLLARADRVTAIMHALILGDGDHSLDPQLLPLSRPVRLARMSAVNFALAEFAREAGSRYL